MSLVFSSILLPAPVTPAKQAPPSQVDGPYSTVQTPGMGLKAGIQGPRQGGFVPAF